MQKVAFTLNLTVVLLLIFLLLTGSPFLTKVLATTPLIPFGTPMTWIGLIALNRVIYFGNKSLRHPETGLNKWLSRVLLLSFILALLWAPVSYLLAGNWTYSFSEKPTFQGGQLAMKIFWWNCYAIAGIPLVVQIVSWMSKLAKRGH